MGCNETILNVLRKLNEIDHINSRFSFKHEIPSASTRLIVAFLYTSPLIILKSSASARETISSVTEPWGLFLIAKPGIRLLGWLRD